MANKKPAPKAAPKRGQKRDLRWWKEKREPHETITEVVRTLRTCEAGKARLDRLTRAARLYGDRAMLGLSPSQMVRTSVGVGRLSLNIVRSLVTTARAQLVQGPAPRPMFVTSGGDWRTQKRAQGLTKFLAGVIYQTGFDATARSGALHSANFGSGCFKIYAEHGRIEIERVYPWEIWVDETEAHYGKPRSMYQTKYIDRAVLAELYPDEAEAIEDAPAGEGDGRLQTTSATSDLVMVIEAWHLPSGPEAGDGRHVICVEGCSLLDEEWEDTSFPFEFFHWSEALGSFWPTGIADEVAGIQYEINVTMERIRQCLAVCAVPRVFLERGSKVVPAHLTNEIGGIVWYTGKPPVIDIARAVSPELANHLQNLKQEAYTNTGVSQSAASGMTPTKLQTGRAIRINAEEEKSRFTPWKLDWSDLYRRVGLQVVRLMRRLAKDDPSVEVVYQDPKRKVIERIAWRDVELDEDSYVLQCFPISALPSTPAGRLEALQEMASTGLIDGPTFKRLCDFPDLEAELAVENAPRELLEKEMEEMLYDGVARRPEPFYDLALILRVGPLHYLNAKQNGVDEENLTLLRDYLVATKNMMAAANGNTPGPTGPAMASPPGSGGMAPTTGPLPPDAAIAA